MRYSALVVLLFMMLNGYGQEKPASESKKPSPATKKTPAKPKASSVSTSEQRAKSSELSQSRVKKTSSEFFVSDDFSDSSNSWNTNNPSLMGHIFYRYEQLRMKCISENHAIRALRTYEIDIYEDFTAKVTANWIEGIKNNSFGLRYASNSETNSELEFSISANGMYKVSKLENGKWESLIPWTTTSSVFQDNMPNVLEVRKSGSYISFYINDEYHHTLPFEGFGTSFGFAVHQEQTVDFDDFSLIAIKKL